MQKLLKIYVLTLVIFLALDLVWLGIVAKELYKNQLGYLMSETPNLGAALLFYLIYVVALIFFVIKPAYDKKSVIDALKNGAFFGFVAYATYDLTNLAVLKDWPLTITIIDLIWGTVITAVTSALSAKISLKYLK